MSNQEYYFAFEAILYGLIISRILMKCSQLAGMEKPRPINWTYLFIGANVFLLIIYFFWANTRPQHYENVEGPALFLLHVVIPPSIFTYMTYQVFPDDMKQVTLKNFVSQHRQAIFFPWAIYLLYNIAVLSSTLINFYTIATSVAALLALLFIWKPRKIFLHTFLVIQSLVLLLSYLRPYIF